MPPPKLLPKPKPPPLRSEDPPGWKIAAVVTGALLSILLLILLIVAWWPRAELGIAGGDQPGAGRNQAASQDGRGDQPNADGASLSTAPAGPSASDSAEANEPLPPRPALDTNSKSDAESASSAEQEQPGDGNREAEPDDLGVELVAAADSGTPTIGNFSSPGVQFFGTKSTAKSVAFVVDVSGSMANMTTGQGLANIDLLKRELVRSINALEPNQKFSVVGFNDQAYFRREFLNVKATKNAKKDLRVWLDSVFAAGGTNPLTGMQIALKVSPDVVFLLSDGEFDSLCVDEIETMNQKKCTIHTVSIGIDAQTLREIAARCGGRFQLVQ
jgi:hypothetical protein